jgi:glutamate--cysteine ligase
MALESLAEQQRIEAADTLPFEQYRQAYLSPDRLQPRVPAPVRASA